VVRVAQLHYHGLWRCMHARNSSNIVELVGHVGARQRLNGRGEPGVVGRLWPAPGRVQGACSKNGVSSRFAISIEITIANGEPAPLLVVEHDDRAVRTYGIHNHILLNFASVPALRPISAVIAASQRSVQYLI
jgi:hypothetical protein